MLTSQQFDRTRRLALQLAGIELFERHREVIARRSRRFGVSDHAALDALLGAAEAGDTAATRQLLRLLTTKFTGFFRHPRHFDLAAEQALRVARQRGRARLWSAAAATGEEPYSLAMVLIEAFRQPEPPVDILATDVDAEALAAAHQGEYGELALRTLASARRERFFAENSRSRRWAVASEVRRLVVFRALNLVGPSWSVDGPFDVIFCRNVLMYLETRHRGPVLERLAAMLAPDGLLMLDPAEHPGKAANLFTAGADGVYSLRGSPFPGRAALVPATRNH